MIRDRTLLRSEVRIQELVRMTQRLWLGEWEEQSPNDDVGTAMGPVGAEVPASRLWDADCPPGRQE